MPDKEDTMKVIGRVIGNVALCIVIALLNTPHPFALMVLCGIVYQSFFFSEAE